MKIRLKLKTYKRRNGNFQKLIREPRRANLRNCSVDQENYRSTLQLKLRKRNGKGKEKEEEANNKDCNNKKGHQLQKTRNLAFKKKNTIVIDRLIKDRRI